MFPAQTSMMPVTVALARFIENSFPHFRWLAMRSLWYPYWYLGGPLNYLSGPIVPFLLVLLHKLIPSLSLFEIYFFLTSIFWALGGVSLYFFVKILGESRRICLLVAFFWLSGLILPVLFPFLDSVHLIGLALLPIILFFYLQFLKNRSRLVMVITIVLITLVLLTDNLILPALLVGMISLILSTGWGRVESKIKQTGLILGGALILATFWYSPGYWVNLLQASSFGGQSLGSVAPFLLKLLSYLIPIFLAFLSWKRFKKVSLATRFTTLWLFVFGFLTLMRFLSDPDFWQDWTGYGLELQLGIALALGLIGNHLLVARRRLILGCLISFHTLFFVFLTNKYMVQTTRGDIFQTLEYRVGKWLAGNIKPEERVFLSGTSTFWLNSLSDISQIRGGSDQGSTYPFWAKASFEIREGNDGEKALQWFKALGVSYVVVHGTDSKEYYHDFKYPEKFENLADLKKISYDQDSTIYQVVGSSLARMVNLAQFRILAPPVNETNNNNLAAYTTSLGRKIETKWVSSQEIVLNGQIKEGEGISLAVTYHQGWKCSLSRQDSGIGQQGCQIIKDSLGSILIDPGAPGEIEIHLKFD